MLFFILDGWLLPMSVVFSPVILFFLFFRIRFTKSTLSAGGMDYQIERRRAKPKPPAFSITTVQTHTNEMERWLIEQGCMSNLFEPSTWEWSSNGEATKELLGKKEEPPRRDPLFRDNPYYHKPSCDCIDCGQKRRQQRRGGGGGAGGGGSMTFVSPAYPQQAAQQRYTSSQIMGMSVQEYAKLRNELLAQAQHLQNFISEPSMYVDPNRSSQRPQPRWLTKRVEAHQKEIAELRQKFDSNRMSPTVEITGPKTQHCRWCHRATQKTKGGLCGTCWDAGVR